MPGVAASTLTMPACAGMSFNSARCSPNFEAACAPTCDSKKAAPPERALGLEQPCSLSPVSIFIFLYYCISKSFYVIIITIMNEMTGARL